MVPVSPSTLLAGAAVLAVALSSSPINFARAASSLKVAKSYVGSDFMSDFDFFTDDDPTHGYVNYVSESVAKAATLVSSTASSFLMRVDNTTAVASGRGRDSVRIVSQQQFGDGLYVLDVNHMPVGCGTWPAFWTTTKTGWPTGGEIDIIEGSNALPPSNSSSYSSTFTSVSQANLTGISLSASDTSSLHTIPTCGITNPGNQTGRTTSTVCDVTQYDNAGCGVDLGTGTWGNSWNEGGGGLYVMWRDFAGSGRIYIYTFPRSSVLTPAALTSSTNPSTIDPSTWNLTPQANFSIPQCPSETFDNHVIVFNIALCGDLAANTFAGSGCAGTSGISCTDFVKGSPGAFGEAYWDVNSLTVYTKDGKVANDSTALKPWQAAVIALGSIAVAGAVTAVLVCLLIRRRRRNSSSLSGGTGALPPSRFSTVGGAHNLNLTPTNSHFNGSRSQHNSVYIYDTPQGSSTSQDQEKYTTPYTSSTHVTSSNAHRRASAPFVENPDGTTVLRRASATTADVFTPGSTTTHRRPSVPFASSDDGGNSPVRETHLRETSSNSHLRESNSNKRLSQLSPSNRNSLILPSGTSTPPFTRPIDDTKASSPNHLRNSFLSTSFFAAPERVANPVFARPPKDPHAPKEDLKIGDGGTAFRHPNEAIPGETPAVESMSNYNLVGSARKDEKNKRLSYRRSSIDAAGSGANTPIGNGQGQTLGPAFVPASSTSHERKAGNVPASFRESMLSNSGKRSSWMSVTGGAAPGSSKGGGGPSSRPGSRRSSVGSDGGGGNRSRRGSLAGEGGGNARGRRVSFGSETNPGDGWSDEEEAGREKDPWASSTNKRDSWD